MSSRPRESSNFKMARGSDARLKKKVICPRLSSDPEFARAPAGASLPDAWLCTAAGRGGAVVGGWSDNNTQARRRMHAALRAALQPSCLNRQASERASVVHA
jgi:hypothetical protein